MDSAEVDDSSRVVPLKYLKKGGITRFTYTHSSCPGLTCSLTCTSLGPYVMVHGMSFCTCWLCVYVLFLTILIGVIHERCDYPMVVLMYWTSGYWAWLGSFCWVHGLNSLLWLAMADADCQKWVSLGRELQWPSMHEAATGTLYQTLYTVFHHISNGLNFFKNTPFLYVWKLVINNYSMSARWIWDDTCR